MRPELRLPVLTEVLDATPPAPNAGPPPVEPPQVEPSQVEPPRVEPSQAQPAAAAEPVPPLAGPAPGMPARDTPPQGARAADSEMARAVLELELEQALRELLEPRLALLLRETARDMAARLGPRMREWLDDSGGGV